MDYKLYKIFESEDFNRLFNGVKVAHSMGSCSLDTKASETELQNKLEDLSVSERLFCSFCNIPFNDHSQQRLHYKLDWHRYNLKQKLNGLKSISEEKFSQQADDLSSISGSSSESEIEDEDESDESTAKQKQENTKYEQLRLMATRHAKVFFENADGHIVSLYRCLLHGKKDVPENDESLIPLALKVGGSPTWAIIMLGGGHFAAAIFQGKEVLVHKTFHCYTVRAKQGGTQSSRDGKSGGSHPKSAGASLRRYNEAALVQHVQDIMESWAQQLSNCDLILYRAVGPHNRNVLFGGRTPPLNKMDPRLRTIPFATRRATFNEVKRVHDILASLELYGSAEEFQTSFPQSPRKGSRSADTVNQDENKQSIKTSPDRETKDVNEEVSKTQSPKRRSKPAVDRAKPRKSPHRPLPAIVNSILSRSSSESDMGGVEIVDDDMEVSFQDLQEFEDTVPQKMKDRKKKTSKKTQKKQIAKEMFSAPTMALRTKLWAACRLGDSELLLNSLAAVQPIQEESESQVDSITSAEYFKCLNENVGDNKETLLHIAAQGGHMAIVRALMEAGCDPSVKNKKSQTPYAVSANKETRNTFRRFLADFPDKYDYSKSHISAPLTDDMEQKMAEKRREQKKVKREKEKERKKEEEAKKQEESEKQRFLKLSDREKRALAAERRLLVQASSSGVKPVVSRCFQCAVDITGKVPFEYDIHRFCSINCLKQHRQKNK